MKIKNAQAVTMEWLMEDAIDMFWKAL